MSRLYQCDACDKKQPKLHFHYWSEGSPHCDTSLCCECNRCDEDCDYRDEDEPTTHFCLRCHVHEPLTGRMLCRECDGERGVTVAV